jgi:hypothetical protein
MIFLKILMYAALVCVTAPCVVFLIGISTVLCSTIVRAAIDWIKDDLS